MLTPTSTNLWTEPEPDRVIEMDGRSFYRINRYDQMPAFLISLVSASDLWMYLSSHGPVAAGRIDEDHSIFPYRTDDEMHQLSGRSGPATWLRVRRGDAPAVLWTPFRAFPAPCEVERNLYKTALSDCIVYEEIDRRLGLTFRYGWSAAGELGFIRTVSLTDDAGSEVQVEILDGLLDILPSETKLVMQQNFSCLINAYCRAELCCPEALAVYSLSAQIVDLPEAVEALTATTVWQAGLPNPDTLLSADQVPNFEAGQPLRPETIATGRRPAYLVWSRAALSGRETIRWRMGANTYRSQRQVQELRQYLAAPAAIEGLTRASERENARGLRRLIAAADGLQASADAAACAHHASAALFNIMRGGVAPDNYQVSLCDFRSFLRTRNKAASLEFDAATPDFPVRCALTDLVNGVFSRDSSASLKRLALEYLPLTFSRRHGDPSRPWNRFSIRVKTENGQPVLNYQGNWRDIFQNWEALAASFPRLLPHMIARFVNASTADGYNPYRISRDGIDWETPQPDNPWSNIGYWGDHQIVYLLKFLEAQRRADEPRLIRMLVEPVFSYADVPYRIKSSDSLFRDAKSTVEFDAAREKRVQERVAALGTDGRLLAAPDGSVHHVNLAEKLLVPALAKLCNLVVDGGIWMNTQRPEWNDANNALVGAGLSMVTLCYLRRYLSFFADLLAASRIESFEISAEVAGWLRSVANSLDTHRGMLDGEPTCCARYDLLRELEQAASNYRAAVYDGGLSETEAAPCSSLVALCEASLAYLDHSIRANRRSDGLYHSYNLLDLSEAGEARAGRLYEMLEGQVAALGAGLLTGSECADLLEALFESKLYRPDLNSFVLYPVRQLPAFLQKGVLPADRVAAGSVLVRMADAGERSLVEADALGVMRFAPALASDEALASTLDRLETDPTWGAAVKRDRADIARLYEEVFRHSEFTGRSGSMYGYEGIGCTYWHMVSKLLLAAQECAVRARAGIEAEAVVRRLSALYYRVREGLGFTKSSHLFGAFPTDPYSHTPADGRARQPGMTGQTKEDILARFGELGVTLEDGCLRFDPFLLRRSELSRQAGSFAFIDVRGKPRRVDLPPDSLGFTYCQVPVRYRVRVAEECAIRVSYADKTVVQRHSLSLSKQETKSVIERLGEITAVDVFVDLERFYHPEGEAKTAD